MGSPTQLLQHISVPRWNTYREYAKGKHALALQVYEWNLSAAAAAHTVLSVVEVALRNAMDRSLREWNPVVSSGYTQDWTITPCEPLRRLCGQDLEKAQDRADQALRTRRTPNHDDLVAHLMFGTWRFLLPMKPGGNSPRVRLFNEAFGLNAPQPAFPGWSRSPHLLGMDVKDLHTLRNRVAHHEPLMQIDLPGRLRSARRVLDAMDPALSDWLDEFEQLTTVIGQRPRRP